MTVPDFHDDSPVGRAPVEILPLLWRFKWTIVAAGVLAACLAYALSLLQPTEYRATAQLLLSDPRNSGVLSESRIVIDPVRYVRTQAELAESTPVLTRAAETLGGGYTVQDLESNVSVQASRDLDLITVVATDPTARGAKDIADAVGQAYQDQVRAEVQSNAAASIAELEDAAAILDARVAEIESKLATDPEDASLNAERDAVVAQSIAIESRINQITVDTALYGTGVQLFEQARLPKGKSQPTPARNAALGLVLGLMAGTGYAWWVGEKRRVATSRHDPAPVLRAPLLGVIPDLEAVGATTKSPTLSEPNSVGAEAYHFVASSLEHHLDSDGAEVILVTSPGANDGKTVTAFNVAVAIARGGRTVLLVDADERARGLSRWQGVDDAVGLTDLGDDLSVEAAQIKVGNRDEIKVSMIPAGSRLGIGAGFFRSSGFRRTMQGLRDGADAVVIDSPPILEVADALAVAGRADGVVLVVNQGTSYQALEDARDRLLVVGTPLLGYVFNRAKVRGRRDGYGYGYGYGAQAEAQAGRTSAE